MGVPSLESVLDERYYKHLKGGVLEAMGKLFPHNLKLYIYPTMNHSDDAIITSNNITPSSNIKHLYAYLKSNKFIHFSSLDQKPILPYHEGLVFHKLFLNIKTHQDNQT